ncbi:MAG: hypothetical protein ACFE8B_07290 [Candidatus Hermodarchaeota archaeon]
MIFETLDFLDILAEIASAIILFFKRIISTIGAFLVDLTTAATQFFKDNLGSSLTFYIVICAILVVSGIIVNIIWPGDRPGTIFSKGVGKLDEFEVKIGVSDEDIVDEIKRCKDCGNPVGDSEICPLCGARQI